MKNSSSKNLLIYEIIEKKNQIRKVDGDLDRHDDIV